MIQDTLNGQLQILTMEHHEDEGCNVLFADGADGCVEFIEADKTSELKWIISENSSDK